jgi:anti-sigma regulatory factor (Ser/Thr protein kinase)
MSAYDAIIRLPRQGRIVQFREFLEFCERLCPIDRPARVLVDFEHVSFAHATGMAPTVSVIRHLTNLGWDFDVVLPGDDFLCSYFYKAGWVAAITGDIEASPTALPGNSFIPLTQYSSASELNPVLNEALRHFTQHSVYETGVLEGIEWALNEVADNVLIHAGGVPGWLQLAEQRKKGLIEIVVADCGQGVCSSLHERFPELADDRAALEKAVEKGVTRNPDIGQGNGLAGTLRIAIEAGGWVNLHSGRGLLRYMPGQNVRSDRGVGRAPSRAAKGLFLEQGPPHQGTVVSLTIPTSKKLDVAGALWGNRPMSTFETQYVADSGRDIVFAVANETSGFGNRDSARPLRQRLHNLFNLYPDMRVVVDFRSVDLLSASFADEFIARLAKDVGVASFFQRATLTNMNDLVRRTMDAVLEQRLRS